MQQNEQDLDHERGDLKQNRKLLRKRTWPGRRSKLGPFAGMLDRLSREGSSLRDLQLWLDSKGMQADRSTIKRFLDNLRGTV